MTKRNGIRVAVSAIVAGLASVAHAADPTPSYSISMSPTSIAVLIAATVGVVGSLWFFNKITK